MVFTIFFILFRFIPKMLTLIYKALLVDHPTILLEVKIS